MTGEPIVASLELGGTKCIAAVSQESTILHMTKVPSGSDPVAALAPLLNSLAI